MCTYKWGCTSVKISTKQQHACISNIPQPSKSFRNISSDIPSLCSVKSQPSFFIFSATPSHHHHSIFFFFINSDFHILVTFLLKQLPHDQPQGGRKPQPEILSVTWDKNVRAKRQQKKKQQQRLKHMDRHYGARPTNQDPPELATDWVSDSVWFQKQGRGRLLLKKRQRCQQISLQLAFLASDRQ